VLIAASPSNQSKKIQYDGLIDEFQTELSDLVGVKPSQKTFEEVLVGARLHAGTSELKLPSWVIARLREVYDEARVRETEERTKRNR
jgi:hypothetical protein